MSSFFYFSFQICAFVVKEVFYHHMYREGSFKRVWSETMSYSICDSLSFSLINTLLRLPFSQGYPSLLSILLFGDTCVIY